MQIPIELKQLIIQNCVDKKVKIKDAAALLKMHPKSLSRLKKRYLEEGVVALKKKRPGPKKGEAPNRTPDETKQAVRELANRYPRLGVRTLSTLLKRDRIYVDPTTVWRILKQH